MWKKIYSQYLIAGLFNTTFSYLLSLFLYYKFIVFLNLIIISFITYLISISVSFFIYKFFVFKTKGFFLQEYFRFYLVYGVISFLSILCLWILVDFLLIRFWIAQGLLIFLVAFLSFFANKGFTFNVKR